MAGAAGLPSLARKTRQRVGRLSKTNCETTDKNGKTNNRSEQSAAPKGSSKTTATASHRAPPYVRDTPRKRTNK
jgi:hypothetical protein